MRKLPVLLLIGLCLTCSLCRAAESKIEERTVIAALEAVRSRDFSLMKPLYGKAQALPYLVKYITDEDDFVRTEVVTLAGSVGDEEAVAILTAMTADQKSGIASAAVATLYNNIPLAHVQQYGGLPLRRNLLRYLTKQSSNSAHAILLCSAFPDDQKVVDFLQELRLSAKEAKTNVTMSNPDVPVAYCIDIALAALGSKEKTAAVLESVKTANVHEMIFLCEALPVVNDPHIMHAMIPLLDNKAPAQALHFGSAGKVDRPLCDVVLDALVKKSGVTVPFSTLNRLSYSADELRQAKQLLMKVWPDEAVKPG